MDNKPTYSKLDSTFALCHECSVIPWSTQSTLGSYVLVVNSTGAGQEASCMVLCLIRNKKE
jgi:hypothetical protein